MCVDVYVSVCVTVCVCFTVFVSVHSCMCACMHAWAYSDKLPVLMLFTALQFSQALTYLDTAQQEVKASLGNHSDMLKQVSHIIMIHMKRTLSLSLSLYQSAHWTGFYIV